MFNKKIIVFVCLLFLTSTIFAEKNLQVPKNVKVLSQSCTMTTLFITVIDLSNNEIVILQYGNSNTSKSGELITVTRTGMFVNPQDKISFLGNDAPSELQKH